MPQQPDTEMLCAVCRHTTLHEVLGCAKVDTYDDECRLHEIDKHMMVACRGCRAISFCIRSSDNQTYEYDSNGDVFHPETDRLYPSRLEGRPEMEDLLLLPHGIAQIYRETHTAICGSQHILTGIGIRAIVEAVCKEKSAKGKDLKEKIDGLATAPLNIITPDSAKILHGLRFMGNSAAHEVKSHSIQELKIAFGVVEHLLRSVYVIPAQARHLPPMSAPFKKTDASTDLGDASFVVQS